MAKSRKYKFKNISKGPVFIPDIRRTLSPGKEWPHVWEGTLSEGTERMRDQKLIEITDAGESKKVVKAAPDPLERSKEEIEKERELTSTVRENLKKLQEGKAESKATVDSVTASEMDVESDEDDESSRLDSLFSDKKKSSKKKKKND